MSAGSSTPVDFIKNLRPSHLNVFKNYRCNHKLWILFTIFLCYTLKLASAHNTFILVVNGLKNKTKSTQTDSG